MEFNKSLKDLFSDENAFNKTFSKVNDTLKDLFSCEKTFNKDEIVDLYNRFVGTCDCKGECKCDKPEETSETPVEEVREVQIKIIPTEEGNKISLYYRYGGDFENYRKWADHVLEKAELLAGRIELLTLGAHSNEITLSIEGDGVEENYRWNGKKFDAEDAKIDPDENNHVSEDGEISSCNGFCTCDNDNFEYDQDYPEDTNLGDECEEDECEDDEKSKTFGQTFAKDTLCALDDALKDVAASISGAIDDADVDDLIDVGVLRTIRRVDGVLCGISLPAADFVPVWFMDGGYFAGDWRGPIMNEIAENLGFASGEYVMENGSPKLLFYFN